MRLRSILDYLIVRTKTVFKVVNGYGPYFKRLTELLQAAHIQVDIVYISNNNNCTVSLHLTKEAIRVKLLIESLQTGQSLAIKHLRIGARNNHIGQIGEAVDRVVEALLEVVNIRTQAVIATSQDVRRVQVDGQLVWIVGREEQVVLELSAERAELPRQVVEQSQEHRVETLPS